MIANSINGSTFIQIILQFPLEASGFFWRKSVVNPTFVDVKNIVSNQNFAAIDKHVNL